LKYRKGRIQPLQQATLLTKHEVTRHTQTEGIIDVDQDIKILSTQIDKASPKTLTRLSYQSTSKETLHQKLLRQHWWQLKHTYTQHDQIQEIRGNKMAQNFGMIANYGEPKEKAKITTIEVDKLPEGRPAELEMKKPRGEESGEDKATREEEKTQAT
jgi:hypothetical protein